MLKQRNYTQSHSRHTNYSIFFLVSNNFFDNILEIVQIQKKKQKKEVFIEFLQLIRFVVFEIVHQKIFENCTVRNKGSEIEL